MEFKDLKVGDRVLLHTGYSYNRSLSLTTITGETPKSFRVGGKNLFSKTSGFMKGGDKWNCAYITPFDQEEWNRELVRRNHSKLVTSLRNRLDGRAFQNLPIEVLEALNKVLTDYDAHVKLELELKASVEQLIQAIEPVELVSPEVS
jgi:hypothetical protein